MNTLAPSVSLTKVWSVLIVTLVALAGLLFSKVAKYSSWLLGPTDSGLAFFSLAEGKLVNRLWKSFVTLNTSSLSEIVSLNRSTETSSETVISILGVSGFIRAPISFTVVVSTVILFKLYVTVISFETLAFPATSKLSFKITMFPARVQPEETLATVKPPKLVKVSFIVTPLYGIFVRFLTTNSYVTSAWLFKELYTTEVDDFSISIVASLDTSIVTSGVSPIGGLDSSSEPVPGSFPSDVSYKKALSVVVSTVAVIPSKSYVTVTVTSCVAKPNKFSTLVFKTITPKSLSYIPSSTEAIVRLFKRTILSTTVNSG